MKAKEFILVAFVTLLCMFTLAAAVMIGYAFARADAPEPQVEVVEKVIKETVIIRPTPEPSMTPTATVIEDYAPYPLPTVTEAPPASSTPIPEDYAMLISLPEGFLGTINKVYDLEITARNVGDVTWIGYWATAASGDGDNQYSCNMPSVPDTVPDVEVTIVFHCVAPATTSAGVISPLVFTILNHDYKVVPWVAIGQGGMTAPPEIPSIQVQTQGYRKELSNKQLERLLEQEWGGNWCVGPG